MTASPKTLVIAAYVFAASFSIPRHGPERNVTDHEPIALAIAQAVTGLSSHRRDQRSREPIRLGVARRRASCSR